jgi:hypothetical protein
MSCPSFPLNVCHKTCRIDNLINKEDKFKIEPRYDVYDSPTNSFNFWKLKDPPTGIEGALNAFDLLDRMSKFRGYYLAIQGIK